MLKKTFFFLILVSLLLCYVSLAQVRAQGVNLDAVSSADTGPDLLNSLTFSHTVGADTNRLLIVGVSIQNPDAGDTVASVTYGGTNLTNVGARSRGTFARTEIWSLVAPATGTYDVVVTLSGTNTASFVAGAISFTGVNQTSPLGSFFSAGGRSTTPSVNVRNVNEGEVVIDTVARNDADPAISAASGQTQHWNRATSSGGTADVIGASSTEPSPAGGGTVTMSWSSTSTRRWAIGAVAIKPANPTAVKLVSFAATRHGAGALLTWKTGFEVNNLGFHVYREVNGELVRLTPDVIAGSALLAGSGTSLGAGRSYQWWDISSVSSQPSGVGTERYWIEDMDLNGKRTWHGPVVPFVTGKPLPKTVKPEFLSDFGTRLEEKYDQYWRVHELKERLKRNPLLMKGKGALGSRITTLKAETSNSIALGADSSRKLLNLGLSPQSSSLVATMQQLLAGGPSVKLTIKEHGWYRVMQPELVAAGLNPSVNPRYLQLYVDGVEQPVSVSGGEDGRFDPQDAIEFYGVGLDTLSTDARVYWLMEGTKPGKRIQVYQGKGAPLGISGFPFAVEKRDRTIYFAALKNGEASNFFGSIIAGAPVNQLLNIPHPDAASSGQASLEVALQGVTHAPHRVKVFLNEVEVGEAVFAGQSSTIGQWSVPQSLLLEGENLVTLMPEGGDSDVSLVDVIRLTYWHTYGADDDLLRFTVDRPGQLLIEGFSDSRIRVVDITDPEKIQEITGKVNTGGSGFTLSLTVNGSGSHALYAFTERRIKSPAKVEANGPSSWYLGSNGADLVIISHRDFLKSMEALRKDRESQGLSVALMDVADLYDEFNFGQKSPQAIKDFLTWARTHWKKAPQYVVLVGDGSFDPRNFLGLGNVDFVPAKLIDTAYLETASDDWFVDFNNDGLPEMAIGRLPVRTVEESDVLVSKIVGYRQATPMQEAVLVADINDTFNYETVSEELRGLLPSSIAVQKIFRGDFGTDGEARNALIGGINQGPLLVNYFGHGSVEVWNGGILSWVDADALINGWRLPFFINMTCFNGMFHDVYTESLSEALLKAEAGGAVAVWASSGLTEPEAQAMMNRELIRVLFNGESITLGEAVKRAKAATTDPDAQRTWILFGDPTTKLKN
jgi:Peptidase family C25